VLLGDCSANYKEQQEANKENRFFICFFIIYEVKRFLGKAGCTPL